MDQTILISKALVDEKHMAEAFVRSSFRTPHSSFFVRRLEHISITICAVSNGPLGQQFDIKIQAHSLNLDHVTLELEVEDEECKLRESGQ